MRILVTGATGFIGSHVVPALLDAGHEVRALARGVRPGALPSQVELVRGTVADPASVEAAAKGTDACLHLVAIINERGEQTFARVNVAGTANVVRAMRDAGVDRLVHMSALGVGPDERFPYLRSKWEGEEHVRGSGLDWTILRPSTMFGPGAGFFRPIVWQLRWMPFYPLPAGGRTRFQPLDVADLARCVARAFEGAASKESVDFGGPEILTYREIAAIVMRALGKRRPMVAIPLWAARPFATIQQLRADPLVTNQQLDMVVLDNVAAPDAVATTFGFEPKRMEETDLRWLARL